MKESVRVGYREATASASPRAFTTFAFVLNFYLILLLDILCFTAEFSVSISSRICRQSPRVSRKGTEDGETQKHMLAGNAQTAMAVTPQISALV